MKNRPDYRLRENLADFWEKVYNRPVQLQAEFIQINPNPGLSDFRKIFGKELETSSGNKNGTFVKGYRYVFGEFEVDPAERTCIRSGEAIPLTGKVFDVLLAFVENPNRLLGKDELMERVWRDEFVEEGNLARNISTLRKALGDNGKEYRYIATVQGRGYRFVGDIKARRTDTGASEEKEKAGGGHSRRWILWIGAGTTVVFAALGFAVSRFSAFRGNDLFSKPIGFRRLTTSGHVLKLAFSPDGNLIAFTSGDKNGESLFVRQTSVSNEVNLAFVKGQISSISFSPDSKLIYYSVFHGDASEGELYSVPILGGVSRSYPDLKVLDFSFAPDGYHFAGVNTSRDRGESVLVIDDLDNSQERELTRRQYPSDFSAGDKKVAWAPNGRSIALVVNENAGDIQYSTLLLVDPDTGAEDQFTPFHWTYIDSVQWISDSKSLVVAGTAGRDEPDQLYIVSLDGAVRRLTNDVNNYSLVAANAANRSITAIQTVRTSSVWSGSPESFSGPAELTSGSGTLAPITFLRDQIVFRASGIGGSDLWGVPLKGGEKRPLTQEARVDPRGLCSTLAGKVVFSSKKAGKNNLWRLDTDDGSLQQITFGENEIFPACTPDGKWVIFQRMASTNQKTSLWKVSIDGGETKRLTDFLAVRPTISPDGQWVAVFYMDDPKWKIGLVSVDGGGIEKSFELPEGMSDRIARWSPDGRALLLAGNYGDVGNIWRIPIDGSVTEKITDLDQQNIEDFIVSPFNGGLILSRSTTISDVFIATEN